MSHVDLKFKEGRRLCIWKGASEKSQSWDQATLQQTWGKDSTNLLSESPYPIDTTLGNESRGFIATIF